MLLLMMSEWVGPQHHEVYPKGQKPTARRRTIGMVTRLTLPAALRHISQYETAYKKRYRLAAELTFLAVSEIDDLTDEEVRAGHLEIVEELNIEPKS